MIVIVVSNDNIVVQIVVGWVVVVSCWGGEKPFLKEFCYGGLYNAP